MVNKVDFNIEIDKQAILRDLKFVENTESYKNANEFFEELSEIIINKMKLRCLYSIIDKWDFPLNEIIGSKTDKIVICFLSSDDKIGNVVNEYIKEGAYLKGYLLNEIATYVIFNTSNKLNEIIKDRLLEMGLVLRKRYSPGDDGLDLKYLQVLLDALKKEVPIDASLTENYMIIPEKSLLYFGGPRRLGIIVKIA